MLKDETIKENLRAHEVAWEKKKSWKLVLFLRTN